jgi:hypothetical protein
MLRRTKIAAIAAMVSLIGAPAAGAQTTGWPGGQSMGRSGGQGQTMTWGVFRENANNEVESARNCWSQAMVTGSTINGEVLAERLTEQKAQDALQSLARRGLCAAERTAPNWTARGQEQASFRGANFGDFSSGGGSSASGSNADGSGSAWSNAGQFNSNGSNRNNAGPFDLGQ